MAVRAERDVKITLFPNGLQSPTVNCETRLPPQRLAGKLMDIDFDFSSFGQSREETSSIHRLQRAWISERSAPDILPYESRLLESISTRLKEQVSTTSQRWLIPRFPGLKRSCCLNMIQNGHSGQSLYKLRWNEWNSWYGRIFERECIKFPSHTWGQWLI